MEIKAYKCELCKEIFESETQFNKHKDYCDCQRACDEIDKLFHQKVEPGEGWKEESREELDREYGGPRYEYEPEISKASDIDKIKKFIVTEKYMVTEVIVYVREE